MNALRLSIGEAELADRMRHRLRGAAAAAAAKVVWQQDASLLLIHLDSLQARCRDGWLLCSLQVQTDPTGLQTLQLVFFLGRIGKADGLQASCTVNAPTAGAARIAAVWGEDLQRVLWDAVLDALEAGVHHAGTLMNPKDRITLAGFHCGAGEVHVEVVAGDL